MTDTKVTELFSFDKIDVNDTTHQAVIVYSRFTKASATTKASMAAFVVRFGRELQGKYSKEELTSKKIAIAVEFNRTWDAELLWITSAEAGDDRLSDNQIKSLDAARRKVGNTIKYGGDLSVLDTSNKCQDFNKEEKAKEDGANDARVLREEAVAMGVAEGLEEGTPEHDKFVEEYIKKHTPDNVEGGKEAINPTMVFSQKIGEKLVELEKSGMNSKEFGDFLVKLETLIDNRLNLMMEDAALDSELVDKKTA